MDDAIDLVCAEISSSCLPIASFGKVTETLCSYSYILVSSHFDGPFFINKPFEWKHKRPGGPTFCIGISQAGTSMTSVAANLASSKVELFSLTLSCAESCADQMV